MAICRQSHTMPSHKQGCAGEKRPNRDLSSAGRSIASFPATDQGPRRNCLPPLLEPLFRWGGKELVKNQNRITGWGAAQAESSQLPLLLQPGFVLERGFIGRSVPRAPSVPGVQDLTGDRGLARLSWTRQYLDETSGLLQSLPQDGDLIALEHVITKGFSNLLNTLSKYTRCNANVNVPLVTRNGGYSEVSPYSKGPINSQRTTGQVGRVGQ